MSKDLILENLDDNLKQAKKVKSGSKGKRGERDVVHSFNLRFVELFNKHPDWGAFSRSVGSGNRWGQGVYLPKHAKDTYTGDITSPSNFRFVLESKNGYNDVDLFGCWFEKCRELDDFLKQVSDDATRSGRMPLLLWKKDRKGRVAFLKKSDWDQLLNDGATKNSYPSVYLSYNEWIGVNFDYLLQMEDSFFFNLLPT